MPYFWKYVKTWLIIQKKRFWQNIDPDRWTGYTKFVILCSPRTGSTLLHTYLNSHSQILSYGEIVRRTLKSGKKLLPISQLVFKPHTKKIKAVGLKVFYEHQNKESYNVSFNEIAKDSSVKVIHLTRGDKEAQYKSLKRAEVSGVWSTVHKGNVMRELESDNRELYAYETQLKIEMEQALVSFKAHEILEIAYEDLIDNQKETLNNVQRFLNTTPKQLFTLLKKMG